MVSAAGLQISVYLSMMSQLKLMVMERGCQWVLPQGTHLCLGILWCSPESLMAHSSGGRYTDSLCTEKLYINLISLIPLFSTSAEMPKHRLNSNAEKK